MKTDSTETEISLDRILPNTWAVIQSISGDGRFVSRAAGRGLTTASCLFVVQNFRFGPMIVFLRDTQLALGRSEAKRVIVRRGHAAE
jgi:ferrous iron transport protein A